MSKRPLKAVVLGGTGAVGARGFCLFCWGSPRVQPRARVVSAIASGALQAASTAAAVTAAAAPAATTLPPPPPPPPPPAPLLTLPFAATSPTTTGREVVGQLLCSPAWGSVVAVGRRAAEAPAAYASQPGFDAGKLQNVVCELADLEAKAGGAFQGADSVFCCLGTTRAAAGSADAFRAVRRRRAAPACLPASPQAPLLHSHRTCPPHLPTGGSARGGGHGARRRRRPCAALCARVGAGRARGAVGTRLEAGARPAVCAVQGQGAVAGTVGKSKL